MRQKIVIDSQERRYKQALCAVATIVGLLAVVNVFVAAHMSHLGITLQEIEDKATQIEASNQELKRSISQRQSIRNLEDRAQVLGYVPTKDIPKVNLSASVALR